MLKGGAWRISCAKGKLNASIAMLVVIMYASYRESTGQEDYEDRKRKRQPVTVGVLWGYSWWPGAESNHRHKDFQNERLASHRRAIILPMFDRAPAIGDDF